MIQVRTLEELRNLGVLDRAITLSRDRLIFENPEQFNKILLLELVNSFETNHIAYDELFLNEVARICNIEAKVIR